MMNFEANQWTIKWIDGEKDSLPILQEQNWKYQDQDQYTQEHGLKDFISEININIQSKHNLNETNAQI